MNKSHTHDVWHAINNERRRWLIKHLADEGTTTLPDLATERAKVEAEMAGAPDVVVTADARKRVYVSFYQTHLPALHDAGIIEWDRSADVIEASREVERIADYIREGERRFGDGEPAPEGEAHIDVEVGVPALTPWEWFKVLFWPSVFGVLMLWLVLAL